MAGRERRLSNIRHFWKKKEPSNWDSQVMVQVELNALTANRDPTGSLAFGVTIGIVCVACLAASTIGLVSATMTSTFKRTNSAARGWELFRLALGKP